MKKLLMALCFTCALAMAVQAGEGKKARKMTDEQKTARKALVEKYDANKDGKLDKDERSKITAAELAKAGYAKKGEAKKGEAKKEEKK